jgi:hypothetical protein
MENNYMEKIFVEKTHSLKLIIDKTNTNNGSRIGGYAPVFFDNDIVLKNNLNDYLYYFTIGNEILNNIENDNEISVFIPKEFSVYNKNYKYPNFPIKCIMHKPSGKGNNEILYNKNIKSKKIISKGMIEDKEEVEDIDNEGQKILQPIFGIKIGGEPSLLQNEPDIYYKDLMNDNYQFIMQFDESEYLKEQITDNEPFNHGIIYFYGKIVDGKIKEFIGGYWQN